MKFSTIEEAYEAGKEIGRLEGMFVALNKLSEQTRVQCEKLAKQIKEKGAEDGK